MKVFVPQWTGMQHDNAQIKGNFAQVIPCKCTV